MNGERRACALTGHRKLDGTYDQNALYDRLEALISDGCDTFYCGMAQGFDLEALECLVSLRKKYKIFIEACVPFEGQETYFPAEEKRRYRALIGWCDKKTVLQSRYSASCYFNRNRYMVDRADVVLAYLRENRGGTHYTVEYAKKQGKDVILL